MSNGPSRSPVGHTILGKPRPNTPEETRQARLTCAAHSETADELRELLDMLGIGE